MKIKKVFLSILVLGLFGPMPLFAKAKSKGAAHTLEMGGGINAFTGGRTIPSVELAYLQSNHTFSWAGTGVRNKYYYQSSHLLFYFRSWLAGEMWGGDISSGFGVGAGFSERGFQDYNSTTESKETDVLLGPAIRVNWSYGPIYLNLSVVYGLRDLQKHVLGLNFQNVESLTLGFRF